MAVEPRSAALEADALPLGQRCGFLQGLYHLVRRVQTARFIRGLAERVSQCLDSEVWHDGRGIVCFVDARFYTREGIYNQREREREREREGEGGERERERERVVAQRYGERGRRRRRRTTRERERERERENAGVLAPKGQSKYLSFDHSKPSGGKIFTNVTQKETRQTGYQHQRNQLKQTNEFKYLGSMFIENGKLDREIEIRRQKAKAVNYQLAPLLKHPTISTSTKAKLINAIFLPTLTYRCQTWSLTKDLERKLVTCEMKCLRKAVNKTRRDKIRNEVIRDMSGAKPVLQHAKQQQIKWFGHIAGMPINQPALRAYSTKYSGWRARGRPRKRWSDSVADTLRTQGMSLLQATRLAADRQLCSPRDAYRYKRKKKVKVK